MPKPKRLPERKRGMTLVAAFRCRNDGILLCADREENDGYLKRDIDKIYRFPLSQYHVFITGAGASTIILRACEKIHQRLSLADANGVDIGLRRSPELTHVC
jgi:hypothetical protein